MSKKILIIEDEFDTYIMVGAKCIHEGSGHHTREALRTLAESFALAFDLDFEHIIRDDNYLDDGEA